MDTPASPLYDLDSEETAKVIPIDDKKQQWQAKIKGPNDSEWKNAKLDLEINLTKLNMPTIRFTNKMYHPNIDAEGFLCPRALEA